MFLDLAGIATFLGAAFLDFDTYLSSLGLASFKDKLPIPSSKLFTAAAGSSTTFSSFSSSMMLSGSTKAKTGPLPGSGGIFG